MKLAVFGTAAASGTHDAYASLQNSDGNERGQRRDEKDLATEFGLDGAGTIESVAGVSKYRTSGFIVYTLSADAIDISTLVIRGQRIQGPDIGKVEVVCGAVASTGHAKGTVKAGAIKAMGKSRLTVGKAKIDLSLEMTGDLDGAGKIKSLKLSGKSRGKVSPVVRDLSLHFGADAC